MVRPWIAPHDADAVVAEFQQQRIRLAEADREELGGQAVAAGGGPGKLSPAGSGRCGAVAVVDGELEFPAVGGGAVRIGECEGGFLRLHHEEILRDHIRERSLRPIGEIAAILALEKGGEFLVGAIREGGETVESLPGFHFRRSIPLIGFPNQRITKPTRLCH